MGYDVAMTDDEYKRLIAETFARRLEGAVQAAPFVGKNPSLIGALAEQLIRQWIRQIVAPINVSTGTIVGLESHTAMPDQLDIILWAPNPLPAVMEIDDFAIVPRPSVLAVLEIKNSDDNRGLRDIARRAQLALNWMPKPALFKGVICSRGAAEMPAVGSRLATLHENRQALWILEGADGATPRVNVSNLFSLFNFLAGVRQRYMKFAGGTMFIPSEGAEYLAFSPPFPESFQAEVRQIDASTVEFRPISLVSGSFEHDLVTGTGVLRKAAGSEEDGE